MCIWLSFYRTNVFLTANRFFLLYRLGTGWSYHTGRSNKKNAILSVEEQDHILTVVRRNEQLEEKEKVRIG